MARRARPLKQRKDRAPSVPAATYRGPEWLRWVAPAVIGATALAMFVWSWETWPDVIVDFGRELYVPWRLSAGEVLYRDLAYFNGPLSPYLNSIWFRLFGTSIHVLAFANLAILFALCALMYTLLADIGSRISAFLASLFFVLVFAFSLLGMNFNYISPYSHEMTHGLALSLAALFFLRQFVRSERMRDVGLSGLCLGLVFLTKPEVFVAALAATVVGLGLALSGAPSDDTPRRGRGDTVLRSRACAAGNCRRCAVAGDADRGRCRRHAGRNALALLVGRCVPVVLSPHDGSVRAGEEYLDRCRLVGRLFHRAGSAGDCRVVVAQGTHVADRLCRRACRRHWMRNVVVARLHQLGRPISPAAFDCRRSPGHAVRRCRSPQRRDAARGACAADHSCAVCALAVGEDHLQRSRRQLRLRARRSGDVGHGCDLMGLGPRDRPSGWKWRDLARR